VRPKRARTTPELTLGELVRRLLREAVQGSRPPCASHWPARAFPVHQQRSLTVESLGESLAAIPELQHLSHLHQTCHLPCMANDPPLSTLARFLF
jgi:hypothetical protein